MPYVTSTEQYGIEKGMEKGRAEGQFRSLPRNAVLRGQDGSRVSLWVLQPPGCSGARTTRKPILLFRLSGLLLLRCAERQLFALLFQLPPRTTRFEWSAGL